MVDIKESTSQWANRATLHPSDEKPTYLAEYLEKQRTQKAAQDTATDLADLEGYLVTHEGNFYTRNGQKALETLKKALIGPSFRKVDIEDAREVLVELEKWNRNIPLEGYNNYTVVRDIPKDHHRVNHDFETLLHSLGNALNRREEDLQKQTRQK